MADLQKAELKYNPRESFNTRNAQINPSLIALKYQPSHMIGR